MVRIGVNGFGRLGRLLTKIAIDKCGQKGSPCELPRVVVVNDPNFSPVCMGYLFQNDTFYGKTKQEVVHIGNCIVIEGQRVETLQEPDITKIPWSKACPIDYVVDTTGDAMNCASVSKHLRDSVKRVITIGANNDVPFYVYGVNHTCYKNEMKSVSASTPSLNCLCAMLRVLHENFCVTKAMSLAIHPLSNKNNILDDSIGSGNCRESRSATMNFCPVKSEACGECVPKIMPELFGKTQSTAIRIPVPCVGAVDLTVFLAKEAPYDVVKIRLSEAAGSYMRGVMRYSNEELVSSDIIGDPHSCVIDGKAGAQVKPDVVKIYGWYDSEYAFAHRIYDMIKYIASREQ